MSQLPGMWPEKPVGDKSHGSKLPGYQTPWPGAETGETLKARGANYPDKKKHLGLVLKQVRH